MEKLKNWKKKLNGLNFQEFHGLMIIKGLFFELLLTTRCFSQIFIYFFFFLKNQFKPAIIKNNSIQIHF